MFKSEKKNKKSPPTLQMWLDKTCLVLRAGVKLIHASSALLGWGFHLLKHKEDMHPDSAKWWNELPLDIWTSESLGVFEQTSVFLD